MNSKLQALLLLSLPACSGVLCAIYERLNTQYKDWPLYYLSVVSVETALMCFFFVLTRKPASLHIVRNPVFLGYVVGGILISVVWWLLTSRYGITKVASFESSYPLFALLAAVIINKRSFRISEFIAVVLIISGAAILGKDL